MSAGRFTLCVYCGSRAGAAPAFAEAARAVGREIGRRGWGLVYGGGRVGLMGELADATLAAGGHVIGVIPGRLMDRELGHSGVHELQVVASMHARKQAMATRAHAFLALPGGIGTLEELFEVWTWRHLGDHDQPVGLLNVAGFYDRLLDFLGHARSAGFLTAGQQAMLEVGDQPAALLDRLAARAADASGPDDFRAI